MKRMKLWLAALTGALTVSAALPLTAGALTAGVPTGDRGLPEWVWVLLISSVALILALILLGTLRKKDRSDEDDGTDETDHTGD